jgi:hypothetical protein
LDKSGAHLIDKVEEVIEPISVSLEVTIGRSEGGNTKDDDALRYAAVAFLYELYTPSPSLHVCHEIVLQVTQSLISISEFMSRLRDIQLILLRNISRLPPIYT